MSTYQQSDKIIIQQSNYSTGRRLQEFLTHYRNKQHLTTSNFDYQKRNKKFHKLKYNEQNILQLV